MPLSQTGAKYFLSRKYGNVYCICQQLYSYHYSDKNINIIIFHLRLAPQSFELLNIQLQHEEMCLVSDTIFFQTPGLLNPAAKSANAHLYKTGVYILRLRICRSPHFSPVLIERFNAKYALRCVIYIRITIRKRFIDFLILAFCDLREFLLRHQYSFFAVQTFLYLHICFLS